jgi:hypothetical protein
VGCKEEEREGLKATRIEDIWIIISRSEYNRLRPNCIGPRAVENFFFIYFYLYFILAENKIIIKTKNTIYGNRGGGCTGQPMTSET